MNEERPIQTGKWWALLIFAAGSQFTAILPRLITRSLEDDLIVVTNQQGGSGITSQSLSAPLGTVLVFWVVLCTSIGVWILGGQEWRPVARNKRQILGLAYLGIAWIGGFAWSKFTPPIHAVVILLGALLALAIADTLFTSRRRKHEDGEIFP